MIAETPSLQRQVQPESRFVTLIKNEFIKHAKEINRLSKVIEEFEFSGDIPSNIVTEEELQEELSHIQVQLPSWIDKIQIDNNGKLCQVVSE